mgnify:CR=1 FL=1
MKIQTNLPIELHQKMNAKADTFRQIDDKESSRTAQLKKQSNELEAVFLTQLIQSMEKTVPEGASGSKNSLSTMMFGSVMGDAMTQGGGIGLSKMIFESLKNMDEVPDLAGAGGNDYLQSLSVLQSISSSGGEK